MLGRSLLLAGLLGATAFNIASAAPLAPLAGLDADEGLVTHAARRGQANPRTQRPGLGPSTLLTWRVQTPPPFGSRSLRKVERPPVTGAARMDRLQNNLERAKADKVPGDRLSPRHKRELGKNSRPRGV